MLNWNQYNILSTEEQKEYDWRFRDLHKRFGVWGINSTVVNMGLIIVVLVFIVYLTFTIPELEQYKTTIKDILKGTWLMMMISIWYTIAVAVFNIVYYMYGLRQYYKWKKEINFKERWQKRKL